MKNPFQSRALAGSAQVGRFGVLLAWLALLGGIGLTVWLWHGAERAVRGEIDLRLSQRFDLVQAGVQERMAKYAAVVTGAGAMLEASRSVSREVWSRYTAALALPSRFPGLQSLSYAPALTRADLATHQRAVRREGYPKFYIWPLLAHADYTPVTYVEPFEGRNLRALGFDMSSEPVRRRALELARDSGTLALSDKVRLVVETESDVQAGILMYYPLYGPGPRPASVAERRARLTGFAVGALRMSDLMQGVLGQTRADVGLRLYDAQHAQADALLFSSQSEQERAASDYIGAHRVGLIAVRNQEWTLRIDALPAFEATFERRQPRTILLSGLTVSVLAFASLFLLATGQRRATLLARQMSAAAQARDRRFAELARHAPVGIFISDGDGSIQFVNERWCRLAGLTVQQAQRRGWLQGLHPDDRDHVEAFWARAIDARRAFDLELRFQRVGADPVYVAASAIPEYDAEGVLTGFIGTCMDITARRLAEFELQRANEALERRVRERTGMLERSNAQLQTIVRTLESRSRARVALTELSNLLGICNSLSEGLQATGRTLEAIFPDASGALYWCDSTGVQARAVASWGQHAPAAQVLAREECWALRRGQLHHAAPGEDLLVCEHLDGVPADGYTCAPLSTRGQLLGLLFHQPEELAPAERADTQAQDADFRQWVVSVAEHLALALANLMLRETLEAQARDDPLTGLHNRRYMEEALEREVRRAERSRRPMGVMMLDLDHFKRYNDSFGHAVGDRLLVALGAFLKAQVRAGDIVCRYGGEEFLVILPETGLDMVVQRAAQLRQGVSALHVDAGEGRMTSATLSVGVAVYPVHGSTAANLVRAADAALYRAKRQGRNCVQVGAEEAMAAAPL